MRRIVATLIIPLFTLTGIASLWQGVVPAVQATANCTRRITALNQFANVRASASANAGVLVLRQLPKGEYAEVDSLAAGWYHLRAGGYVSASVAVEDCLPLPTATRTATVAPRTPTRLPTSTVGPSPTATGTPSTSRITVYELDNGTIRIDGYCVQACEWNINMENLP